MKKVYFIILLLLFTTDCGFRTTECAQDPEASKPTGRLDAPPSVAASKPTGRLDAPPSAAVRVAILHDLQNLTFKTNDPYTLMNPATGKVLHRGEGMRTTIALTQGAFLFAGLKFKTNRLLIRTDPMVPVTINGRTFKGDITLVRESDGTITVINEIDIEEYVKGIMYHEASHYWPEEALKAQAVASRTYALYQVQERKGREYDVTSDVFSQVYGGESSERYRTNRAVEATRDQILTYKGKVIPAYFHATCAGHTEDASELWYINLVPLKGVTCDWCVDSPHYHWHAVLSREELSDALSKNGRKVSGIESIEITKTDPSGRVSEIAVGTKERTVKIAGKDFRAALGPDLIRSLKFEVRIVETDVVFEGSGWGHGVGMCQWGAYFMAKAGRTYKEILQYYYPHSDVTPL